MPGEIVGSFVPSVGMPSYWKAVLGSHLRRVRHRLFSVQRMAGRADAAG